MVFAGTKINFSYLHPCFNLKTVLLGFINWVDNVNQPPQRDSKADVSIVSPLSERIVVVVNLWSLLVCLKSVLPFGIPGYVLMLDLSGNVMVRRPIPNF